MALQRFKYQSGHQDNRRMTPRALVVLMEAPPCSGQTGHMALNADPIARLREASSSWQYFAEHRSHRQRAKRLGHTATFSAQSRHVGPPGDENDNERSLHHPQCGVFAGIFPWIRIPNLVSHILSSVRLQLPGDWDTQYRVTPVLMETFVEIPRFTGAVYKRPQAGPVSEQPGDGANVTEKTNAPSPGKISGSARTGRTGKEPQSIDNRQRYQAFAERLQRTSTVQVGSNLHRHRLRSAIARP